MGVQLDYERFSLSTVSGCLAEWAERMPEKLAVIDNIRRLSDGDLWSEVQALAAGLQNMGVRKGDGVEYACSIGLLK